VVSTSSTVGISAIVGLDCCWNEGAMDAPSDCGGRGRTMEVAPPCYFHVPKKQDACRLLCIEQNSGCYSSQLDARDQHSFGQLVDSSFRRVPQRYIDWGLL
jgi:hypothetical protein